MSRFSSAFGSVLALSFGQVAIASTPVSFFVQCPPSTRCDFADVGPAGLVITDLISRDASTAVVWLYETVGESETPKAYLAFSDTVATHYGLQSGVVFAPESVASFEHSGGVPLTIAGYIPTPAGNVPAVNTVGLVLMAVVVLGAGAVVLSRRKQPVV